MRGWMTPGESMTLSTRVGVKIMIRAAGQTLEGTIHGLSRRGVFFRSDSAPPVGAAVQVYVMTSATEGLVVPGQVEWREASGGCGVMFSAMPAFAAMILRELSATSPLSVVSPAPTMLRQSA